jgi:hypothetical protein
VSPSLREEDGTVNDRVRFLDLACVVQNLDLTVTGEDHELTVAVGHVTDVVELDATGEPAVDRALLDFVRNGTAEVECTPSSAVYRLADGLGGNHANRFTSVHQTT